MTVKLHVDLETLQLIQGPGQRSPLAPLKIKRGDSARLQVAFLENGLTPALIGDPAALQIQFGVKPRNQFDSPYLAHTAEWTMPAEGDDAPTYQCAVSFNTTGIDAALGLDGETQLAEITLMGEITWREGTAEPTSTRTFLVVVENDVNRGTEGVPVSADPPYPAANQIEILARKGQPNGYAPLDESGRVPAIHLPGGIHLSLTALTGANSLATIPTTSLSPGHVIGCVISGILSFYQLQADTSPTILPGIVRPDDFHATTNTRVWKQVL